MITFDVSFLAAKIRAKRGKHGLRRAAEECGVSPATLSRVERGIAPNLSTLNQICEWLGVPIDQFVSETGNEGGFPDTLTDIEARLRADRMLSPEAADALSKLIRISYEVLSQSTVNHGVNDER